MVFLNPLVLLGLAAAAIPLILHLLNLRKLRTIEFSTLTFLKELQQTKIRRLKLRQLLLLLIRTLLIVLIVLAFARPALHGTMFGGFGSHANSTVVFILDDSFSLSAADERGELFKQAKEAMNRLVEILKEGDEAFLIRLSDLPKASVEPATHDFAALKAAVDESQVSAVRRPMSEAMRAAGRLLQVSKNANKEVYIVSDMQRSTAFYRDLVGLKVQFESPEWTQLDAGNIGVGLHGPSEKLHPQHTTTDALRAAWKAADALGVDSIWTWDHFYPLYGDANGAHFEGWTLLAAMAVETQHAELNPSEESRACRNERDEQSIVDVLGILRCVVAVTVRND